MFTHNDGRTSNVLQADGTIPMYYQDVKYNIPITIWLLESYPRNAPLVYVTPTRDMIIKPRHPFVNPSGMVSAPYLQGWVYPRSNLVELVKKLSLIFGDDPPLYSRPAQMPVRPPPPAPMSHHPPQSPSPFMNPMHTGGHMAPTSQSSSSSPAQPSSRLSYPPYQNLPPPPRTNDPSETFKQTAINDLSNRLHRDTQALMQERNIEMDGLFNTQVCVSFYNCHFPPFKVYLHRAISRGLRLPFPYHK
jgi:ESCRT-I complex subunit TSG101